MLRFWLNGSKEEVEYVNYIYSTPSYPSRFIMLIVKKKKLHSYSRIFNNKYHLKILYLIM